jgi:hypothetical protein
VVLGSCAARTGAPVVGPRIAENHDSRWVEF